MKHLVIEIKEERETAHSDCDDCPERVTEGELSIDLSGQYMNRLKDFSLGVVGGLNRLTGALTDEELKEIEEVFGDGGDSSISTTIEDFTEEDVEVGDVDEEHRDISRL